MAVICFDAKCRKCGGIIAVRMTHGLEPYAYINGKTYIENLCQKCAEKKERGK